MEILSADILQAGARRIQPHPDGTDLLLEQFVRGVLPPQEASKVLQGFYTDALHTVLLTQLAGLRETGDLTQGCGVRPLPKWRLRRVQEFVGSKSRKPDLAANDGRRRGREPDVFRRPVSRCHRHEAAHLSDAAEDELRNICWRAPAMPLSISPSASAFRPNRISPPSSSALKVSRLADGANCTALKPPRCNCFHSSNSTRALWAAWPATI